MASEKLTPPDVWGLGRRWLIRQYRVTQPRAELERKARKARGRASRYPLEDSDLHGHAMVITDLRIDAMFPKEQMPLSFCHLCHSFAQVGEAVMLHRPGCSYGPERKALLSFYRLRLGRCSDFRAQTMPRPYAEAITSEDDRRAALSTGGADGE